MSAQKEVADMSAVILRNLMAIKTNQELRALECKFSLHAAKNLSFSTEASIKAIADEIERREYNDRLDAILKDPELEQRLADDDPFIELRRFSCEELVVLAKTEYAKSTLTTGYESLLLRLAAEILYREANHRYE